MAYTPVLNDILELRVVTFDPSPPTQLGINVVHLRVNQVLAGGVQLSDIVAAYDAAIAPVYKIALSLSCSYRGCAIQKIWPLPRTVRETSVANAGPGLAGADQVPTQVAGLIKVPTNNAGRPFRGRAYISFLATTSITAQGNATAGYILALNNLADQLFKTIAVSVGAATTRQNPVIWHPRGYGNPPANAKTSTDITAAFASPLLATQRRRGNYGRINASTPF